MNVQRHFHALLPQQTPHIGITLATRTYTRRSPYSLRRTPRFSPPHERVCESNTPTLLPDAARSRMNVKAKITPLFERFYLWVPESNPNRGGSWEMERLYLV